MGASTATTAMSNGTSPNSGLAVTNKKSSSKPSKVQADRQVRTAAKTRKKAIAKTGDAAAKPKSKEKTKGKGGKKSAKNGGDVMQVEATGDGAKKMTSLIHPTFDAIQAQGPPLLMAPTYLPSRSPGDFVVSQTIGSPPPSTHVGDQHDFRISSGSRAAPGGLVGFPRCEDVTVQQNGTAPFPNILPDGVSESAAVDGHAVSTPPNLLQSNSPGTVDDTELSMRALASIHSQHEAQQQTTFTEPSPLSSQSTTIPSTFTPNLQIPTDSSTNTLQIPGLSPFSTGVGTPQSFAPGQTTNVHPQVRTPLIGRQAQQHQPVFQHEGHHDASLGQNGAPSNPAPQLLPGNGLQRYLSAPLLTTPVPQSMSTPGPMMDQQQTGNVSHNDLAPGQGIAPGPPAPTLRDFLSVPPMDFEMHTNQGMQNGDFMPPPMPDGRRESTDSLMGQACHPSLNPTVGYPEVSASPALTVASGSLGVNGIPGGPPLYCGPLGLGVPNGLTVAGTTGQRKPKLDTEAKRQIHIISEQKRRAIIKDAFCELENELIPLNRGRKPSKIQTLQRSVELIRFLKGNQEKLVKEVDAIRKEREHWKGKCFELARNAGVAIPQPISTGGVMGGLQGMHHHHHPSHMIPHPHHHPHSRPMPLRQPHHILHPMTNTGPPHFPPIPPTNFQFQGIPTGVPPPTQVLPESFPMPHPGQCIAQPAQNMLNETMMMQQQEHVLPSNHPPSTPNTSPGLSPNSDEHPDMREQQDMGIQRELDRSPDQNQQAEPVARQNEEIEEFERTDTGAHQEMERDAMVEEESGMESKHLMENQSSCALPNGILKDHLDQNGSQNTLTSCPTPKTTTSTTSEQPLHYDITSSPSNTKNYTPTITPAHVQNLAQPPDCYTMRILDTEPPSPALIPPILPSH